MPFSQHYSDDLAQQLHENNFLSDLGDLRELNNGSGADLDPGEIAIDTNRGGVGTVSLVWKSQDGATTGYVDLTAGY